MAPSVRWGILGSGRIARSFADALRRVPGASLAAVASRSREKALAFARELGVAHAHGTYQELVDDPNVEVVYVATPSNLHREHCLLALHAGRAVVCEKPFATTAREAREVVERARERGLFCMEAMWMRFVPASLRFRAMIAGGAVGSPVALAASLGFRYEFDAQDRLFDPQRGGGALLDLAVYPISLAVWLLGRPTRVCAEALRGETGVDEQVAAILSYPGCHAVVEASLRGRLANDAVVTGTEGVARLAEPLYCPESFSLRRSPPIGLAPSTPGALRRILRAPGMGLLRRLGSRLQVRSTTCPAHPNGLVHEAAEVVRCLRAGLRESPAMPLDETVASLEVIDDVRECLRRSRG